MGPARQQSEIETLRQRLGADWAAISNAYDAAAEMKSGILVELAGLLSGEDTSLVVFGSLGRGEVTRKSDVDWTLLVDGAADPQHLTTALAIEDKLKKFGKEPGREGTFGGLASSHDLIHKIGGSDDTNRNTTQRILLLLESDVIGPDEAYNRVIRNVLRRYVLEDSGWMNAANPLNNVPRFLQNDIARYWRTMAVDFAHKRRLRQEKGWALRNAKLRMSRKLIYAAGLLMCFSTEMERIVDPQVSFYDERDPATMFPMVEHLFQISRKTPLEILARVLLGYDGLEDIARELFDSYDEFLALLNNDEAREELDTLSSVAAVRSPVYQHVRDLGTRFQNALTGLFLEENGTPLPRLTKTYGVF